AGGALEDDGRMLGDVEEIGALEMVIALRLSAPEFGGVDGRLDGSERRSGRIELERSMHVLEMAAHPTNHHMANLKLRRRMARFKDPFWHGSVSMRWGEVHQLAI